MIRSMTGYAARTREVGSGASGRASLSIELKSVNSRFLDLVFRLPEELRALEPLLRERIALKVQRGKVECRVAVVPVAGGSPDVKLNGELLVAIKEAARQVQAVLPDARSLSVADVLHWPGMLSEQASAGESLQADAVAAFEDSLNEFVASREREGHKLATLIADRVAGIGKIVEQVQPLLPEALAAYQEKIASRLRDALKGGDEDRIRQELALFGIKFDVAEELSRLEVHAAEVLRVLSADAAAGKRLDFLMQELNREANTLGSKAVSREIADAVVELKLLIEQMREQVQNIE